MTDAELDHIESTATWQDAELACVTLSTRIVRRLINEIRGSRVQLELARKEIKRLDEHCRAATERAEINMYNHIEERSKVAILERELRQLKELK